jgi:flavin reductase (DIM6/NTAB) family NADH-FMN oxidoreductase RutF
MTVSSFTSVSLNPPLILVCIDKRAGFGADLLPDVCPSLAFAVNVLQEDQEALAVRFSTGSEQERFAGLDWKPGLSDVPLLAGTVASFTCTVENIVNAGDHFIFVGRVQELRRSGGRPLVWCESGYHCLPDPRASVEAEI